MDLINSSENKIKSYKRKKNRSIFSRFFVFINKKRAKKELLEEGDDDLDHNLVYSLSSKKIPGFNQLKYAKKVLSAKERVIVNFFTFIIFLLAVIFGMKFYRENLVIIPVVGGGYTEGLIGSPKNINPIYSMARDVDNDISRLVFSSLFTYDINGGIIRDLVENYVVSDNGLEHFIKIKEGVKWHHGEGSLSSDDVIFTFSAIKNPEYGSPLRGSFPGVNIEKIDDLSFKFVLGEPYAGFLELLTFGILPQNLWSNVYPQNVLLNELNIKPIGSGPYKLKSLTKSKSGDIREFNLVSNEYYYGRQPYIPKITLKFFSNYNELIQALNNGQIDGVGYLPHSMKSQIISKNSLNFNKLNLPQITSLFVNSKKNSLLNDKEFRQSLARLIDRNKISNEIFSGDAGPAYGPISPSSPSYNEDLNKFEYDYELATSFLDKAGWNVLRLERDEISLIIEVINMDKIKLETDDPGNDDSVHLDKENKMKELDDWEIKRSIVNNFYNTREDLSGLWRFKKSNVVGKDYDFLVLNLTTIDLADNVIVSDFIKLSWEKAGIRVFIKTLGAGQIQSEIIKQKNFEILLLSQVIGSDQEVYAFWHSSQIGDTGLNIVEYKNKEVDKLLDDARLSLNVEDRIEKYSKFQEIINNDFPVIFLYYPTYNYIQGKKIKGFESSTILNPSDRFNSISNWYIKIDRKIKTRD